MNKTRITPAEPRADEALRRLVGMIFDGRLSPGTRLPAERELAEQLGVSRTTLRDAMSRLRARGYIESRSKSGSYVCTAIPQAISQPIEEIVEAQVVGFGHIIEIREILELWAVMQAARQPTADGLAALRQSLKAMQQASALRTEQQLRRYSDADLAFHQAIAEMTGNPLYIHLIHFIGHLIRRSISLSRDLVKDDFPPQNLAAHQRIYEALRAGDELAAREAMVAHFDFVKRHLRPRARPVPRGAAVEKD
jgi:GntR family transcriptional regulator, transcriptional repressor for pyruvate dehydrogenase complex